MKVTVNKYLNARIGEASTNATCKFYHIPGETIEIDDVLVGTDIDGNSVWYHCKDDGCYYWSGGIVEVDFWFQNKTILTINENAQIAWVKNLQNDKEWELRKKIEGYIGCAIGFKNDDPLQGISLVIYVDRKRNNTNYQLPSIIYYKGVQIPTDIKEIIKAEHQYVIGGIIKDMLLDNDSPLQMGGTICPSNLIASGTRGLKLKKGNDFYLLTCFHVLLHDIKQQGFYIDNGDERYANYPNPKKNHQNIKIRKIKIKEGFYNSFYDYATAILENSDDVVNSFNAQRFKGFYDDSDIGILKGKNVTMVGSSSLMQRGLVQDMNAVIFIENNTFGFNNIIVSEKISTKGDSGAAVVDDDNKLVGIIIGGNDVNKSFILPIHKLVLNKDYLIDFKFN